MSSATYLGYRGHDRLADMNRTVGRIRRASLTTFLAVAFATAGACGEETVPPLAALLDRLEGAKDGAAQTKSFYEIWHNLDIGQILVANAAEGDRLAAAVARLLDGPMEPGLLVGVTDFFARYPHPVCADDMLRLAQDNTALYARFKSLGILASLKDERLLPILLARLKEPEYRTREILALFAALGTRGARDALAGIVEGLPAEDSFRRDAERTLASLDLTLETGIESPFDLDVAILNRLRTQGFAIVPEAQNEMYDFNFESYPFVTSDLAFHSFMILVRHSLDSLESMVLVERAGKLSREFAEASLAQAARLDGELAALARRNAAFFAVPLGLMDPSAFESLALAATERECVNGELVLIVAHQGVAPSKVFAYEEDFTSYKPRGRHDADDRQRAYFRAMLYYGRMMLRVESVEETKQALLLGDLLESNPALRKSWGDFDSILALFFGERDDLAFPDYEQAVREMLRAPAEKPSEPLRIARDDRLLAAFRKQLASQRPPRINTAYLHWTVQPNWRELTAGLRVFGQRYSRPAHLLQSFLEALPGGVEWDPSGLSIAAHLFGSRHAGEILREAGRDFGGIAGAAPPADPLSTLQEGLVHCAGVLFRQGDKAPPFMRTPAWEEKCINTALGGWVEVQHATHLYVKDAHDYACASRMLDRFHGAVEPVPDFFARLRLLSAHFREALEAAGLFAAIERVRPELERRVQESERTDGPRRNYDEFTAARLARLLPARAMFENLESILARFEAIAKKELAGEPQTIDDGMFLKSLGRRLKHLAFNDSNSNEAQESMALVTDPATEYLAGECFQIGVGKPWAIYVAFPDGGRTRVCKGAVYTYCEFTQRIERRLSDAEWKPIAEEPYGKYLPWVARRPDLRASRVATREELLALRGEKENTGANSSGGNMPWKVHDYLGTASKLAQIQVLPEDIDVLIELASADPINIAVRHFALTRLEAFATDPRVLACYRGQLDKIPRSEHMNHLDHTRLYYSIRGLGYCGREAHADLQRAAKLLDGLKYAEKYLPIYRCLLADALEATSPGP